MRTLELNRYETLAVPDADGECAQMANYDKTGWVQLGRMGSSDSLLIDKSEWVAFVEFVNELDAHMKENKVGAYTLDEDAK
jgi:hypothetical protein